MSEPARYDYEHPSLQDMHGSQAAPPETTYGTEVQQLRQRVADLEAELAATRAAVTAAKTPAAPEPVVVESIFVEVTTPAVVAATPAPPAVASETPAEAFEAPVPAERPMHAVQSNPGFADAWTNESEVVSFEERLAERAFFETTSVDQESRSWLLNSEAG